MRIGIKTGSSTFPNCYWKFMIHCILQPCTTDLSFIQIWGDVTGPDNSFGFRHVLQIGCEHAD